MTPPPRDRAANVIRIDAGNQANVSNSTISRGAIMAIAALLLGGGGAVGGSLIASPAAHTAAMQQTIEDCSKRLHALEEERVASSADRAAMKATLDAIVGQISQVNDRVGRVQSSLDRHIERADRRGR